MQADTVAPGKPLRRIGSLKLRDLLAAASMVMTALVLTGCGQPVPELPVASPAPISFDVGSRPDFAKDMIGCLTESGWSTDYGTDGGYSSDIPNGQLDQYHKDQAACEEKFGYDAPAPVLSDAQIREVYPHMLWEWKCLDESGYSPEPPLTEQAYVDDYHEYGGLWTPYSQYTSTLGEDDLNKLFKTCPRAF